MKKIIPVSIIIPTKNEEELLPKLLGSINAQTVKPCEVIVADANSTDDTRDIAQEYGATIIDGGKPAVGRNNGARISSGDICLFLDADTKFLGNNLLKEMYEEFLAKKSDFSFSRVKGDDGDTNLKSFFFGIFINITQAFGAIPLRIFQGGTGSLMMVTRKAFDVVGGFPEDLEYLEDTEFVFRLFVSGFKHKNIKQKIGVSTRRITSNPFKIMVTLLGVVLGRISLTFYRTEWFYKFGMWLNRKAKILYGALGGKINWERFLAGREYSEYKPDDRHLGYPAGVTDKQRRIFEFIPGFITWVLLFLPVIFALMKWDVAFVIYIAYLVAYWTVRSVKFVYGVTVGVKRMAEEIATDWMAKIKEERSIEYEELRYIYLCPVYGETLDTLEPSFEAWANSTVDSKKIDVVIAMEDRKADFQKKNFEVLKQKYGDKFGKMRYYIHPSGIPGEIAGVKGGNINWAARNLVKDFEKEGKDLRKYLLITCDSDLRPHPKYLAAVTYKYLTVKEPNKRFYASAVHTFNNNIWRVPHIIRAQSSMLTLVLLQNWVINKVKKIPFLGEEVYVRDSFSSYIVNLKTLQDYKFWDPEVVGDDTAFYWNVMARSKGTFKSQEVYIPTYNDAVENETYLKSHISFYKQQHRWGWGIASAPRVLSILWYDKDFPWYRKLFIFDIIFETQLWYLSIIFVLTFGLNIMGWINPGYNFTSFAYNLPRILSFIFAFITLSNIPIVIFRRKITPIPKGWKWWRHILDFAETILITVNMLTFGFLPILQAQTEMMIGRDGANRNFNITEKVKMKK